MSSPTTYPDIFSGPNPDGNPHADTKTLRSAVEARLSHILGADEVPAGVRERLDAELAWAERSGSLRSWAALARLVDAARERHIPLGAPLGCADGTLMGATLCGLPLPDLATLSMVPLVDYLALPPGIEVPGARREELLQAVAAGAWEAWTPDGGAVEERVALWLRGTAALQTLDDALALAASHPVEGLEPEGLDATDWPTLNEGAIALLKRGDVAGISYLSASALKGWKGDVSPDAMGAIVARSVGHGGNTKQPEGITAWAEHSADTGGALLYYDQYSRIVEAASAIPRNEAAALRLAMLRGESGTDGDQRARFDEGCRATGLEDEAVSSLWNALAPAAPTLVPRQAALAWARVALMLATVKATHPAAFFSAALDAAWEREGPAAVRPLAEDARRMAVTLLPPDIKLSEVSTALQKVETGWAVRWGLARQPGWGRSQAEHFVVGREKHNGYTTLRDLAAGISEGELSPRQIEVLVLSGACDSLGGRDAVLAALLGAAQDKKEPPGELAHDPVPGPRLRYARRAWELDNLGVGFTNAHDMDALRRALSAGSAWSGRLTGSARIRTGQEGQSVYLVGLLHEVRQLGAEIRTPNEGKSGQEEKVAVAWVEDLEGAIELVAFPPNYKRHAALWTENNMVIVTARVRAHSDGEGVYLLCEHMAPYNVAVEEQEINITIKANKRTASVAGEETTPLPTPEPAPTNGGSHKVATTPQDVMQDTRIEIQNPISKVQNEEEPGYELIITLPSSPDDHEDIDRMIKLDRLLKGHRGPDTVILRIPYSPETGSYTKAQLPRGVRYSSVLEMEIRDLLGPDALALIKLLG